MSTEHARWTTLYNNDTCRVYKYLEFLFVPIGIFQAHILYYIAYSYISWTIWISTCTFYWRPYIRPPPNYVHTISAWTKIPNFFTASLKTMSYRYYNDWVMGGGTSRTYITTYHISEKLIQKQSQEMCTLFMLVR